MIHKLLFIVSIIALALYAWTGNQLVDEDVLLTIAIGGFVASILLTFLIKVGKFLLTVTALLLLGLIAFQYVLPAL
ncbi:hypothetical protein IMZ31_04565 [Pontibacillus sp. ALD_SL1]|uniref:hypothetical protein n=1 Tax=Pontibacillus sp. ALD_SL1 TaxID=2777185 RepID=UPI001A96E656|nr:hypothetical protein [Pontibacillus sp. ALD_SL1]QST00851.1 hypothetical protein IMZ31_04565 [Pontibacillus sp. ALD_SL1]